MKEPDHIVETTVSEARAWLDNYAEEDSGLNSKISLAIDEAQGAIYGKTGEKRTILIEVTSDVHDSADERSASE